MTHIPATTDSFYNTPKLTIPYTGTDDQPDIVSLFFKNNKNEVFIYDEKITDELDYEPLIFSNALHRIKEAVNRIFLCNDLWNATKNLTRGIFALTPFIGNAALYLYDRVKTYFYTHPKIRNALSNQDGPLLGIAFDGKILTFFSPDQLLKSDNPLNVLTAIWLRLLNENLDSPLTTRRELANKIIKRFTAKQNSSPHMLT